MRASRLSLGLILALATSQAWAIGTFEAYYNAPGTRAHGMVGAFTAAANDASAIWYNPAGLGNHYGAKGDFTLDYSQELVSSSDLSATVSEDRKYKYIGFIGKGGGSRANNMHFGLSYYQPATFSLMTDFGSGPERLDLEYELYTFGIGGGSEMLSWGYTLGFAYVNTAFDSAGYSEDYDTALVISGGLLLHMIRNPKFKLNLGASWFSGADWSFVDYDYAVDTTLSGVVPAIPKRLAYGLNAQFTVPRGLVHFNYDIAEWTSSDDWEAALTPGTMRNNLGIEAMFPLKSGLLFSLRYGMATGKQIESSGSKLDSSSYGIGIGVYDKHFIDYSNETRSFGSGSDYTITSISYSFQF